MQNNARKRNNRKVQGKGTKQHERQGWMRRSKEKEQEVCGMWRHVVQT